jgi:hypothetical protein
MALGSKFKGGKSFQNNYRGWGGGPGGGIPKKLRGTPLTLTQATAIPYMYDSQLWWKDRTSRRPDVHGLLQKGCCKHFGVTSSICLRISSQYLPQSNIATITQCVQDMHELAAAILERFLTKLSYKLQCLWHWQTAVAKRNSYKKHLYIVYCFLTFKSALNMINDCL